MAPRILSASAADALVTGFLERGIGGSVNAAITPGSGFRASATIALTRRQLDAVAANRTLSAKFNRIMTNASKRTVTRLRRVSRPWRTGAFRSSWRADRVAERGAPSDLRTRIVITNPVPYAGYVHERGTPRNRTIVKLYMPGIVEQLKTELIADLGPANKDWFASVRAAVVAQVTEGMTKGSRRGRR